MRGMYRLQGLPSTGGTTVVTIAMDPFGSRLWRRLCKQATLVGQVTITPKGT
jgi:hypothetical protein